jgi:O-antigen/teichoic acid export membrane protein
LEAAFRSFVPQSSTYFNMGYINKLREMSKLSVKLVCFLGVPILCTLIIWAPELINMWLKIEMQSISYAVRIIAFSYIFSLMVSPAYYLFMGIGKNEICFWVYFILSILNFILVLIILFLGIINLKWVVNIFALSLIMSSLYLMMASYKEFGERYFADIKNMTFILLSIVCISVFKLVGLLFNFHSMIVILLISISFLTYLVICYVCNLIPIKYMKSDIIV